MQVRLLLLSQAALL